MKMTAKESCLIAVYELSQKLFSIKRNKYLKKGHRKFNFVLFGTEAHVISMSVTHFENNDSSRQNHFW
jgi:hypothetical protein